MFTPVAALRLKKLGVDEVPRTEVRGYRMPSLRDYPVFSILLLSSA